MGQGSKDSLASPDDRLSVKIKDRLCPYMLFCSGNFFGEYEVLLRNSSRVTSTRCEIAGCCLSASKKVLLDLALEFPLCAGAWRAAAKRREMHRKQLLDQLVKQVDYKILAITIIQRCWRAFARGSTPRLRSSSSFGRSRSVVADPTIKDIVRADRSMLASVEQLRAQMGQLRQVVHKETSQL